ncbi:hypothetical protein [Liquorilactobacillus capillatus]|nr:hypothetical protein [Liquorilactobacillus capillatus]
MKKLWKANRDKTSFWISLVTFLLILGLTYAEFKLTFSFTATEMTLITSVLGSFIILIGNILNNKIIVEAGKSIGSAEFSEKIVKTTQAVVDIQKDLVTLKKTLENSNTQQFEQNIKIQEKIKNDK